MQLTLLSNKEAAPSFVASNTAGTSFAVRLMIYKVPSGEIRSSVSGISLITAYSSDGF
jgi:hypothetical protein